MCRTTSLNELRLHSYTSSLAVDAETLSPPTSFRAAFVREGRVRSGHGSHRVEASAGAAYLLGPGQAARCEWAAPVRVQRLVVPAETMSRLCAELTGLHDVHFAPVRQVSTRLSLGVPGLMNWLDTAAGQELPALSRSSAIRMMAAMVLDIFPNDAQERDVGSQAAPREIRLALEFIRAHVGEDISVKEIAAAANTSERSLQRAFRYHLDATPLGYLQVLRLERAHRDLLAADPGVVTVGEVAARWGFGHAGRFSEAYLRHHGAYPSETLRSSREAGGSSK